MGDLKQTCRQISRYLPDPEIMLGVLLFIGLVVYSVVADDKRKLTLQIIIKTNFETDS